MLSLSCLAMPGSGQNVSQQLTTPNELLASFGAMLQSQTKDCPAPQGPIA